MIADPLLSRAAYLARMRRYEEALKALKSEEDRYYGSFKYYYLYGVISLYSGGHSDALSSFRQARQIKTQDPGTMLGLAVLHLKRLDTVQAVDYYLDVKEIEPANKTAKKALAVIRKYADTDALSDWLSNQKRLAKLYPPIPFPGITPKMIFAASVLAAAVLLAVFTVLVKLRVINPFNTRSERPAAEYTLTGQERKEPVETGGYYRYILTRDQAIDLYDRALSFFTSYRDEKAKVNLNRILESNASDGLKNKARLLLKFILEDVPGFDTYKRGDNTTFSEVKNEPFIYRDVYVIWSGMATNVELTDEFTRFDFLVGYDTRKTLEGIVTVVFDRPVAINTERPLEVLGKIVLTQDISVFRLEGAGIHQSGRLENN